jgi:hypothetical protein
VPECSQLTTKNQLWLLAAALLIFVALVINLESTPPLWWDEGWTLTVARNWVELGHYGRLLDGQLAPRGLEATFPVTASVALSFLFAGVGIVQARLVAVIFTLVAFALLYELARRFYSRSVGTATVLVLIFMSANVEVNPLIMGRQVLGEIPALCFLLGGYLCFILAEKRLLLMPAAVCFWSLALFTKIQVLPFWVIALSAGLLFALIRRQWKSAKMFCVAFAGSLALYLCAQYLFLQIVPSSTVSGLTQSIALVLMKEVRVGVLLQMLKFGLPTLLGLCWGLWSVVKSRDQLQPHTELVQLSFLFLAASWLAWYVFLSVGWPRYILPPVFLGGVFLGGMLDHWTNHFNLSDTIERAGTALTRLRLRRENLKALTATLLIAMSLGQTLTVLYGAYVVQGDSSINDTLRFLNTATPPNTLIETYESELFFLLRRRYHYPADQVHVDLIRRNSLGQRVKIDYDPLAANPDYLVIGRQNRFWDFYNPYLTSGAFRLLQKYDRYEILERVRHAESLKPRGN